MARRVAQVRKQADPQTAAPPDGVFAELGVTGLEAHGGNIYEEFLPELSGIRGVRVFREMSQNDATVAAVLFAIEMLIRQVGWRVAPGDKTPEAEQAGEFVDSCLNDMSSSWKAVLDEILSMLVHGWSWHEVVYKRREGPDQKEPWRRSQHADGRIGWRKLPIRGQTTLNRWAIDDSGSLTGLVQSGPPDYVEHSIPIEKSLLFRPKAHKGNPEGRSVLRGAYRSWYIKRKIENHEAIGVERAVAGIPVARLPGRMLNSTAASDVQIVARMRQLVSQIKNNEQAGVLFPIAYDEGGRELFKLELLTTMAGQRGAVDTNTIITRLDQRIAMTVLADFILVGHTAVGSFALTSRKTKLFSDALSAWLDAIADVFNRHAIPKLMSLNPEFRGVPLPRIEHDRVEAPDLAEVAQVVTAMSGAQLLTPDEDLENALRERAGLPRRSAEGSGL